MHAWDYVALCMKAWHPTSLIWDWCYTACKLHRFLYEGRCPSRGRLKTSGRRWSASRSSRRRGESADLGFIDGPRLADPLLPYPVPPPFADLIPDILSPGRMIGRSASPLRAGTDSPRSPRQTIRECANPSAQGRCVYQRVYIHLPGEIEQLYRLLAVLQAWSGCAVILVRMTHPPADDNAQHQRSLVKKVCGGARLYILENVQNRFAFSALSNWTRPAELHSRSPLSSPLQKANSN